MNIKYIIFAILFSVLYSCTTITEKDLTVVEGIKLGEKGQSAYDKQLEDLGNKKVKYSLLDYWAMLNPELKSNVKYLGYVTNAFNIPKYNSEAVNHSSPILHEISVNTDILIAVEIPLCHARISPITQELEVYQAVSQGYLEEVKNLLIKKYGKPTDTVRTNTFDGYAFPVISDKGVTYASPSINEHPLLGYKWKTKAIDILLGFGRKSSLMYYDKQRRTYMSAFNSNLAPWDKEDPVYERCYEFSFVRYQMNSEAKEKLNTDKPKI